MLFLWDCWKITLFVSSLVTCFCALCRARRYATSLAFHVAAKTFNIQIFLHHRPITFYTICMRVETLNFQRGSKGGEITSWQLYQTASPAYYAKSVRQISSQLASF